LPSPPPLETARARFRACSLSLANAPRGTRRVRTRRTHLHDTPPGPLPVVRGGRTSERCRRRHLLASSGGWSIFLVPQDQREVCPLAGGVIATPIRPITGRPSLPPSSSTRCRIGPSCDGPTRRDDNGFTTFRRCTVRRLGRASPPGERHPRAASSECRSLSPCLLAQACQPLWPVITNGVYRRFTSVDRTSRSWFPTALGLAVAASAHAPTAIPRDEVTLSRGLRTPPLPATHAPVGYCWQNSR
jgi:hypothetical protein